MSDWKLWLVMGVVVCACDVRTETLEAETGDPVSDCDSPGDRTAATFEALTANVWNGPECDYAGDELPPPCDPLTLSALRRLGEPTDLIERGRTQTQSTDDVVAYALGLLPDFPHEFKRTARSWRGPTTELRRAILERTGRP